MRYDTIWWEQIGSSLRLLGGIADVFRDCVSTVLVRPAVMPWPEYFTESVQHRRAVFSAERRLIRLPWRSGRDPGDTVLKELCPERVRAAYWPGQSCGTYLGSQEDLVLNSCDIWVTGIHDSCDLLRWADFVRQYDRAAEKAEKRAVFLLDYDGPPVANCGLPVLHYIIESHDCRVFCQETVAAQKKSGFGEYRAELALQVGGRDPELCCALLQTGSMLEEDPVAAAAAVTAEHLTSDGRRFPALSEQQVLSAAWRSGVVLLFPVLEQWRLDFISRYEKTLASYLPISNSMGEKVTDPFDLEIGALHYLAGQHKIAFDPTDIEKIALCRRARNQLAHNKMISCDDAQRIRAL